ncbi:STAGA complex 65 subunit gamma-like [Diachasmimorpha longicaudata]|uniref:STAGA complex 65 subunit gamma-like n=1 Tax=Diachasmimorpha longicaudata TaxID=58733 RepID=UPI0030B8695A
MKSSRNLSAGAHWGELPARETHKQEVITPDIIENIWRQVLDDSNGADCDYQTERQTEFIQLSMDNPHVLNTIQLHNQLSSMDEGTVIRGVSEVDEQEYPQRRKPSNPFNFLSPRPNKAELKNASIVHHLKPATARNLLKHAVIVLSAHLGYQTASDIAIETLTDVADHFLRKMTLLLKVASEQSEHGFPDTVERVLVETGIGGVANLHDYYQNYVLCNEINVKHEVEMKMKEQREMELNANVKMELDEGVNKIQFEELDEFGNTFREAPTLQLLDPDMGFPPSLDAGFHILQSLEHDE